MQTKWTHQEIFQAVKFGINKKLGFPVNEIKTTTHIINEIHADSLDLVDIFSELERVMNLSVPTELMEDVYTVEQMINVIEHIVQSGVYFYAEPFFKGERLILVGDFPLNYALHKTAEPIVRGGLRSMVVPQGYEVILYGLVKLEIVELARISAVEEKIEIADLSMLEDSAHVVVNKQFWNPKKTCTYIEVNKIKKF